MFVLTSKTYYNILETNYFGLIQKYMNDVKATVLSTNNNLVFVPILFFLRTYFLCLTPPPYTPIRFWPDPPLSAYVLYGRPQRGRR